MLDSDTLEFLSDIEKLKYALTNDCSLDSIKNITDIITISENINEINNKLNSILDLNLIKAAINGLITFDLDTNELLLPLTDINNITITKTVPTKEYIDNIKDIISNNLTQEFQEKIEILVQDFFSNNLENIESDITDSIKNSITNELEDFIQNYINSKTDEIEQCVIDDTEEFIKNYVNEVIQNLQEYIETIQKNIDEYIENIQTDINNIKDSIQTEVQNYLNSLSSGDIDTIISNIQTQVEEYLNENLDTIQQDIINNILNSIQITIEDEVNNYIQNNIDTLLKDYIIEIINSETTDLKNYIDTEFSNINTKIDDINNYLNSIDNDIDDLYNEIDSINNKLNDISDNIENLQTTTISGNLILTLMEYSDDKGYDYFKAEINNNNQILFADVSAASSMFEFDFKVLTNDMFFNVLEVYISYQDLEYLKNNLNWIFYFEDINGNEMYINFDFYLLSAINDYFDYLTENNLTDSYTTIRFSLQRLSINRIDIGLLYIGKERTF